MAFEGLAEKLQNVFSKLTGRGKLSEADIKAAMREVRLALLEADVNYLVVKKFVKSVSEKAVGEQVLQSLTPGQQVIKIVRDELTELLGGTRASIKLASAPPTIILMAGLREKIEYNDIPAAFQGMPIVLLTAGLMSIAFFGFAGLV